MELSELQALWQQTDQKIANNIQLNKEILRRMLIVKPEKRLTWMKGKTLIKLIMPLFLTFVVLIPNIEFRPTLDFYIGLSIFIAILAIDYTCNIQYLLLIRKIKFTDPILTIKKNVAILGKYKIKTTRSAFLMAPIAVVGVILLAQIPILSRESILPFSIIILVMVASAIITMRTIIQQHKKLNDEILEIEALEKNA